MKFAITWPWSKRPAPAITTRQAAQILSKAGKDIQTARERLHDQLRAERAAGLVGGKRPA